MQLDVPVNDPVRVLVPVPSPIEDEFLIDLLSWLRAFRDAVFQQPIRHGLCHHPNLFQGEARAVEVDTVVPPELLRDPDLLLKLVSRVRDHFHFISMIAPSSLSPSQ